MGKPRDKHSPTMIMTSISTVQHCRRPKSRRPA